MKLLFLFVSLFLSATLNAAISFYPGVANGKVVTTPNAVIVYPGTGVSIVTNSDSSITISSSGGGGIASNAIANLNGIGTNTQIYFPTNYGLAIFVDGATFQDTTTFSSGTVAQGIQQNLAAVSGIGTNVSYDANGNLIKSTISGDIFIVTNASGTTVSCIWGAKGSDTIMRLDLVAASNYSFTLTNLPTAGDPPSKFTMELYCAGNAPAIIFNASTKTPNHIDHGPFIVGNTTNFIYFQWDGTNITARSGQIITSTGVATASSVAIDNTTYQHLDITNTIAGNINVLLTNLVIGNFGSFHLKSDGSARTINIYAGISLTFMSTNATLNSTSFVTTASKDLLVCWDTRQQTATTTNTLIWGISGQ